VDARRQQQITIRGPAWNRDSGAERSETAEGKMKGVVLLVPEKRVCTGFVTALADQARCRDMT